jgi:hypothetical protein
MNWIKKVLVIIAWPLIKKNLLKNIQSDEYQLKFTKKINDKIDIPNVSEESEAKLLNQIYDAGQEVIVEFIDNIDIKTIIDKAF